MDLAISKFAVTDVMEPTHLFHGMEFYKHDRSDIVAITEVFQLAQLLVSCSYCLRRVAFGGKVGQRNGQWRVDLGERERLAELNTERMEGASLFRHAGVPFYGMPPSPRGHWWFGLASTNSNKYIWSGRLRRVVRIADEDGVNRHIGPHDAYEPNYTYSYHDLSVAAEWVNLGASEFTSKLRFSPLAALAVIRALGEACQEKLLTFKEGYFLRTFGYTILRRDSIIESSLRVLESSGVKGLPREVDAAIGYLSYDAVTKGNINLANRFPQRMLTTLDDGRILVDFHYGIYPGMQLVEEVGSFQDEAGNLRGDKFESHVIAAVIETVPAALVLARRKHIQFSDGTSREIDVAFVIGEYLVICECKARAQRYFDDIPSPSRLKNRWNNFLTDLSKIDDVAQRLSEEPPVDLGIPSHVRWTLSCVVVPSVEWMDSLEENCWFIEDEIPRICTALELSALIDYVSKGHSPLNARPMSV
jgi:hypothetical protein